MARRFDPSRWSLRLRIFLFFALIGLGGVAAAAVGGVLAWSRIPEAGRDPATASALIFGLAVAVFLILGLSLWVWLRFDENVAKPIDALALNLRTRAHAPVDSGIDPEAARWLGELAPAAAELTESLRRVRGGLSQAVARETAELASRRAQLELVLTHLPEGVLICTPEHRIMLFNRRALAILPEMEGLGLDRPLFNVLQREPIEHALSRLAADPEEDGAPILCATADGSGKIQGRMSIIRDEAGTLKGYVLTFRDVTDELEAHLRRDHLLGAALEAVRRPAANLSALLDAAALAPDAEARAKLDRALESEVRALTAKLNELTRESRDAVALHWPMADVETADLFASLRARLAPDGFDLRIGAAEGAARCDGLSIVQLLETVLRKLAEATGTRRFDLSVIPGEDWLRLEIRWTGDAPSVADLDAIIEAPMRIGYGGMTGRDALDHHRTQLWPATDGGQAVLRLPLPVARKAESKRDLLDRPEFYDFDLMARASAPTPEQDRPLADLSYVVFDTETTGLNPSGGDEIVQIAAARIVNGRILRGEIFDKLVNPGRPIPPASTRIHHITDEMVAGAPSIATVGRQFHAFAEGSVLVAHNAPFDMAFLRAKRAEIGLEFDNPVVDTVLISAHLDPHSGKHTLDALAERLDVAIDAAVRHTARGDAVATAEILLKLLPLLERSGVRTLGDLMAISQRMIAIRKQQAAY